MFKKGEICIVNKSGVDHFNYYSQKNGGVEINVGDKVVCRENSIIPYCTPLRLLTKGCIGKLFSFSGKDRNTWEFTEQGMQSTGEFMELD